MGLATLPPLPTTFTTAPCPRAAMRWMQGVSMWMVVKYLACMASAKASGVSSEAGVRLAAPAELTSTSTGPNAASAAFKATSAADASRKLAATVWMRSAGNVACS